MDWGIYCEILKESMKMLKKTRRTEKAHNVYTATKATASLHNTFNLESCSAARRPSSFRSETEAGAPS